YLIFDMTSRQLTSFPTRRSSDLYLKIMHVEPIIEHSVATLANFEMGFVWEQMIKRALDEQGIKYSFQDQWHDPELNMSGSSDFRSEEHTSELQSRENLVCRLLLE